jgi:POT family proton-dependent oligopeptide transporter
MAIGQFGLAASVMFQDLGLREDLLYYGLSMLILGNGFFKPNISTVVGSLYSEGDPRKDSAFTIFYMGINLGALFSPIICGTLGEVWGWEYGFASAGIGMLVGTVWFYLQSHKLGDVGFAPNKVGTNLTLVGKDYLDVIYYIVGCGLLCLLFVLTWFGLESIVQNIIMIFALVVGFGYLGLTVFKGTSGNDQWSRVAVIFILAVFNVIFWSGFEQAGGTFNLFAKENTDRMLFNWEIPASLFQSINAIMIIAIAPLFSIMWVKLDSFKKNPRTPLKFVIALILLSLGFFVMAAAKGASENGVLVTPMWLVIVYFLHTLGELAISPVGLSMITKLSPNKIVSAMMGVWMGSIALGTFLAGVMESILHSFGMELFSFIALEGLVAAGILLMLTPFLNKMMKGIH